MSVYNINGNIPQRVYDVHGNLLTRCYDKDGNELLNRDIFKDKTTVTNTYISQITAQPQGGCVDDDGNLCTIFPSGKFVKYNLSSGSITAEYSFTADAYGHANGMTYNPTDERYYVASMNETGEIYVFDKSANLADTLYARDENGNIFRPSNIAYDRLNNTFVIVRGGWNADPEGRIYIMNADMSYKSVTPFDIDKWRHTSQDIETDGKYIYLVSYNANFIFVVDFDGHVIKNIQNTDFGGEPESLCYDWDNDVFYMEGKDSRYVIRETVIKEPQVN